MISFCTFRRIIALLGIGLIQLLFFDLSLAQGNQTLTTTLCQRYQGANFGVRKGKPFLVDCKTIARAVEATTKSQSSFAASRADLERRVGMDLRKVSSRDLWGMDDCPKSSKTSPSGRLYWDCRAIIDGSALTIKIIGDASARLERMEIEMDLSGDMRKLALNLEDVQLNNAALDFFAELSMLQNRLVANPRESYTRRGLTMFVTITAR